jgi:hypothetical protein
MKTIEKMGVIGQLFSIGSTLGSRSPALGSRLTNQFSGLAGEPQLLAITMIPRSPPLPSSAAALRLSET